MNGSRILTSRSLRATFSLHRSTSVVRREGGRWLNTSGVSLSPTESEVAAILTEKLNPTHLAVEDVSCGCGTKFIVEIDSEQFRGKRPLQQHRMVNEALGDEMKEIHSVSIKIGGPND